MFLNINSLQEQTILQRTLRNYLLRQDSTYMFHSLWTARCCWRVYVRRPTQLAHMSWLLASHAALMMLDMPIKLKAKHL